MAEIDISELYKAIGSIGAKIDGLGDRVTHIDLRSDERDRHATDKMQKFYDSLNDISVRQYGLESRMSYMEKQETERATESEEWRAGVDGKLSDVISLSGETKTCVESMKPTVDWASALRQRWVGVSAVGVFLLFLFGAAFDTFKTNLFSLFVTVG